MLNSAEHEIFPAHNFYVKMPTSVGILTFMSREKSITGYLSLKKAEFFRGLYLYASKISCSAENFFITSGPDLELHCLLMYYYCLNLVSVTA